MRCVFAKIDGIIKGHILHDYPIGRSLNSATNLEMFTNCIQISIDHHFEATLKMNSNLSSDQSHLRDMILISSGIIHIHFSKL